MGCSPRSGAVVVAAVVTIFCAAPATGKATVEYECNASLTLGIYLARGVIRLYGSLGDPGGGLYHRDPDGQVSLNGRLVLGGSNEIGRRPVGMRLLIGRRCPASISLRLQVHSLSGGSNARLCRFRPPEQGLLQ